MTDNRTIIRQLEELLALIEADAAHYQERRDTAYDQNIKDYFDKKFRRAKADFERISRRVQSLKNSRRSDST